MPRAKSQGRGLFDNIDAQYFTAQALKDRPKVTVSPTPYVEAVRPAWLGFKAQAPERTLILFAQSERRLLWAIDGDAATLRRFVPGKLPYLNTLAGDGVYLRIEDRVYLESLAESEGFNVLVREGPEETP